MEVRAHLRYLRIAPRKVRLVIDLVRGQSVERAVEQLAILPKAAALPVKKLIDSAVANAQHNFKLEKQHLFVKSIVANDGPKLKRYRPRAFGRAAEILKRMSHITVILEDRPGTTAKVTSKKPAAELPTVSRETIKGQPAEPKVLQKVVKKLDRRGAERKRQATDTEVARKGES